MSKRPFDANRRPGSGYQNQHHKRPKHDTRPRHSSRDSLTNDYRPPPPSINYKEAIDKLPSPTSTLSHIPAYTPFTVPAGLPPLPEILDPALGAAPFRHKSTTGHYSRSASTQTSSDVTYEKLEFLGDAQLEHIASRLLYTRFSHLTAGQQSQLRELLVKNETLAEYARAYGFEKQVQVGDLDGMIADTQAKPGNKGFNKVLGDVFEAYIAAVILSGGDEGFAIVEKWMLGLWAPKLLEAAGKDRTLIPLLQHSADDKNDSGPLAVYNPTAKAELQRLILGGKGVKLDYEPWQKSVELKGDMLGQNRHFIAVFLTGYGHEKLLLGKGEGRNKVEAGNWAAQDAMCGERKDLVEKCARELAAVKQRKKEEKEAEAAAGN
ncbi:hypothetical protein LTR62_007436 [Meristemomyces frigidus]|uniref:RNase III domain-containing protein n=1 Tax=Meristemomyces frigidus TaxID=1508187 RepID=A0AAN7TVI7_9PEZI|nr:hypothetical protein LTR62_007436 [Meristemomyces frigidus]